MDMSTSLHVHQLPRKSTLWTWSRPLAFQTEMRTQVPKPFSLNATDIEMLDGKWEIWSPNSFILASYPGVRPRDIKPGHFQGFRLHDGSLGRYDPGFVPQVLTDDTAYFAFVVRFKGTEDPVHYPEWCPLSLYWRKIREPNIGRPSRRIVYYLMQRCEHLEKLRLQQLRVLGQSSMNGKYNIQPTAFTACSLDREMEWNQAVDELAELQLAIKLKMAFYHYYSALAHVGKSYSSFSLKNIFKEGAPTINNPPRFMGGWVNGVSQETLDFLIASGAPCFIIHEYRKVGINDAIVSTDNSRETKNSFLIDPELKFCRENQFDILGQKQETKLTDNYCWPVPIVDPAQKPDSQRSSSSYQAQSHPSNIILQPTIDSENIFDLHLHKPTETRLSNGSDQRLSGPHAVDSTFNLLSPVARVNDEEKKERKDMIDTVYLPPTNSRNYEITCSLDNTGERSCHQSYFEDEKEGVRLSMITAPYHVCEDVRAIDTNDANPETNRIEEWLKKDMIWNSTGPYEGVDMPWSQLPNFQNDERLMNTGFSFANKNQRDCYIPNTIQYNNWNHRSYDNVRVRGFARGNWRGRGGHGRRGRGHRYFRPFGSHVRPSARFTNLENRVSTWESSIANFSNMPGSQMQFREALISQNLSLDSELE